ncbi:MAG: nuclear transport factor 2 family protein [Sphingobium sp.]|nr:nuclear transport factor 2 family protein [Sphingobium sp.]
MMATRLKAKAAMAAWCLGLSFQAAHAAATPAQSRTIAKLMRELDQLDAELTRAEDVAAIRKLQREYGLFLDKGLWEDLSSLFTDDARASYPAGVFIGKASIREHIWRNVGDGSIGIKEGRVYNHMVLQPVIDVAADGKTAKGRWRVLAMIGRLADPEGSRAGQASWAGGIYENVYVKQDGVWKIKDLRYYNDFSAPYEGGWAMVEPVRSQPPGAETVPAAAVAAPAGGAASGTATPPARSRFSLAHQPDQPHDDQCPGFPAACLQPFHYNNPVSGREN